jgi:molecular chaperone GrpE
MTPDANGPSRRPGSPSAAPFGRPTGASAPPGGTDPVTGHSGGHPGDPAPGDDDIVEPFVDVDDGPPVVAEDPLTAASRQRDEYLDMLRRVQADFENYKKRMLRQQTDQLERAGESLVSKLLPALDAFDLTRAHLSDEDSSSAEVKALLSASAQVSDVLAKEGLERIDDPGAPFDPTVHDAVEHAPAAESAHSVGPGAAVHGRSEPTGPVVADVLRPGYRWKGRVIRPAMVRVRG